MLFDRDNHGFHVDIPSGVISSIAGKSAIRVATRNDKGLQFANWKINTMRTVAG